VPVYTDVTLAPETVGELAEHPNVAGIKDSSGSIGRLVRTLRRTPDDFDVLVGNTDTFAAGLDAGATGAILAMANLAPAACAEVRNRHDDGETDAARRRAGQLVDIDHAVVGEHGLPGLKAAMRIAGAPAGRVRRPHRPVEETVTSELRRIVSEL
jgi:dihydrodipicolinate synthase/N-acetylneuraminate lyase